MMLVGKCPGVNPLLLPNKPKFCPHRCFPIASAAGYQQPQVAQVAARTTSPGEDFQVDVTGRGDELFEQLQDNRSVLSTQALLNQRLICCVTWEELDDLLRSNWRHMDFVNVSTVWTRLANLFGGARVHRVKGQRSVAAPPAHEPAFRQFLARLIEVTTQQLHVFGVQALANVMWAMSNDNWQLEQHEPAVTGLMLKWCSALSNHLEDMRSPDVSNISTAIGRLDHLWHPNFIVVFYRAVLRRPDLMEQADATTLNNLLYGLSRARRRGLVQMAYQTRLFLSRCVGHLLERANKGDGQGVRLDPWRAAQLLANCHELGLRLNRPSYAILMPLVARAYSRRPCPLDCWTMRYVAALVEAHLVVPPDVRPDVGPLREYVEARVHEVPTSNMTQLANWFSSLKQPMSPEFWGQLFLRYGCNAAVVAAAGGGKQQQRQQRDGGVTAALEQQQQSLPTVEGVYHQRQQERQQERQRQEALGARRQRQQQAGMRRQQDAGHREDQQQEQEGQPGQDRPQQLQGQQEQDGPQQQDGQRQQDGQQQLQRREEVVGRQHPCLQGERQQEEEDGQQEGQHQRHAYAGCSSPSVARSSSAAPAAMLAERPSRHHGRLPAGIRRDQFQQLQQQPQAPPGVSGAPRLCSAALPSSRTLPPPHQQQQQGEQQHQQQQQLPASPSLIGQLGQQQQQQPAPVRQHALQATSSNSRQRRWVPCGEQPQLGPEEQQQRQQHGPQEEEEQQQQLNGKGLPSGSSEVEARAMSRCLPLQSAQQQSESLEEQPELPQDLPHKQQQPSRELEQPASAVAQHSGFEGGRLQPLNERPRACEMRGVGETEEEQRQPQHQQQSGEGLGLQPPHPGEQLGSAGLAQLPHAVASQGDKQHDHLHHSSPEQQQQRQQSLPPPPQQQQSLPPPLPQQQPYYQRSESWRTRPPAASPLPSTQAPPNGRRRPQQHQQQQQQRQAQPQPPQQTLDPHRQEQHNHHNHHQYNLQPPCALTQEDLAPRTLHLVCWQAAKAGILPPRAFLRLYLRHVPVWLVEQASDVECMQAIHTLRLLRWVPRKDVREALCTALERRAPSSRLPLWKTARWLRELL